MTILDPTVGPPDLPGMPWEARAAWEAWRETRDLGRIEEMRQEIDAGTLAPSPIEIYSTRTSGTGQPTAFDGVPATGWGLPEEQTLGFGVSWGKIVEHLEQGWRLTKSGGRFVLQSGKFVLAVAGPVADAVFLYQIVNWMNENYGTKPNAVRTKYEPPPGGGLLFEHPGGYWSPDPPLS